MKAREITKRKNSIKEEMLTKQKGITLIALVVTIIILLILAGVAINITLGENGLFSKSRQSVEGHKEEVAREKISMAIGEYLLDINIVDMPEEEQKSHLLELLSKLGPTTDGGTYYEVVVDGYVFWVDKNTLEIESKGLEEAEDVTNIEVKEESQNMTVNVGQTKTINLEITPNGASTRDIEYVSSNPEIAEVNNGVVKGIAKGTATITISLTKDTNIQATCTVTVNEIEITGITIDPTEMTFTVGDTEEKEINVTFEPEDATNKSLIWETSDESVATVEKGKVTAVGVGTCDITVTTANNKTATCTVTVNDIEINVSYEPNGSTEWKKTHSVTLAADTTGSTISSIKYKWLTDETGVTESDFADAKSCNNGDTINSDQDNSDAQLTGEYYLWTLIEIGQGNYKISRSTSSYSLDNTPPLINMAEIRPTALTEIIMDFTLSDEESRVDGIVAVSVNGSDLTYDREGYLDTDYYDFRNYNDGGSRLFVGTDTGENKIIKFTVRDNAGNEATIETTGRTKMHVWNRYNSVENSVTRYAKERNKYYIRSMG